MDDYINKTVKRSQRSADKQRKLETFQNGAGIDRYQHEYRNCRNRVRVEKIAVFGNGDGIEAALNAGFSKIYSIELNESLVDCCRERFKGKPVEIISGSSCEELPKILKSIEEPFFLWLDAHFSEGPFIGENMIVYLPKEMACIASLGVNFENVLLRPTT